MTGDDLQLLCEAVREAGDVARTHFDRGVDHWQKPDGTPVSNADLEVNELLHARLVGPRPDYGWLSEETRDDDARLGRRRVWVVDPIDGTRAFLRGDPHWTVSVALVEDGAPVLAAVFNPVMEEFFDAAAQGGARLNNSAINVSPRAQLAGSRILMHRSVVGRGDWSAPWPDMMLEMRNSMAYRLCLVAAGQFDATLSISGKSEWDLAAADLIVREAGGIVSAHDGAPFAYNDANHRRPNVLAAGPALHDTLLQRTRQRLNVPTD
jgi:myo-inositol-1(or 4)-monophosphatase